MVITGWIDRYERWEQRRRQRITGWSVRRRWIVLVLVPLMGLCCCGPLVGVPVVWFLRITDQAGKGAVAPDAAASDYLMALGYGNEDGLLPLVGNDQALIKQWRDYRAVMAGTRRMGAPSSFDFGSLSVQPIGTGRAAVSTDVRVTWFNKTSTDAPFLNSQALTWRIETREDNGWRVAKVEPPAWCGGYVLASACTTP